MYIWRVQVLLFWTVSVGRVCGAGGVGGGSRARDEASSGKSP